MYQIIDSETGSLISEEIDPVWLKQQKLADAPIRANNLEDADGVFFCAKGKEYTLGLDKHYEDGAPNMLNYKPLVRVVEVHSDAYITNELNLVKEQVRKVQSGIEDVYKVQTYGTVPKTELDAAYKEGINAI